MFYLYQRLGCVVQSVGHPTRKSGVLGSIPGLATYFRFSFHFFKSYWRKYVHEVLVNRLGGLSLPRKSVVRLTDRPDMTLDVYRGRKTIQQPVSELDVIKSMSFSCLCRHDTYTNQYRAMFVMNCTVDYNELLKYPQANNKRRKKKQKSSATQDVTSETDKFHPVKCNECNTVVAVYDTDEIYHFFNVLASY